MNSLWKRLVLPALAILLAVYVVFNWDDIRCKLLGVCEVDLRPGMSLVKCPGHPFGLELEPAEHAPGGARVLTTQDLAGPRAVITEVQDCQRLVESDPNRTLTFGPLAALFASEHLATQFDAPPGATGTFGDDRAAAQIYSDGLYSPLGIREGSSCLYITKIIRPADDTVSEHIGYTARMEPALFDDDCLKAPHRDEGVNLEVRTIIPLPQGPNSDLPVAARWAGGGTVGPHYISIRCGERWCEVGPAGFNSEQPPPELERWSASTAGQWAIPGWYDQQHLAVAHTEPNTNEVRLEPSPIRATIMPHPMLATFNDESAFERDWVEVAYAWLPDQVEGYAEKMNFKPRWNRIAYRHGTREQALGAGALKRPCPEEGERPTGEGNWWARVTAADGTEAFFCVTRYTHTGLDLPGVVRWRWMAQDETTWIRCPSGCCPVE